MRMASTGMTRGTIAMLIGGMMQVASTGAASAAEFVVRVKNDTNGVVRTRIQAMQQHQRQANDWTAWSEALPFEGTKSYRFTGDAPTFYIEMQYDDGTEWRHVCTKIVSPARGFTLTTLGAVPHMRCGVTATEAPKAASVTRHRPAGQIQARRTTVQRPAQPAATQAGAVAAAQAPVRHSTAEAPRRRVVRQTGTPQQARPSPPATTVSSQRMPDPREAARSYSREEGCLDDRAFMGRDRPWCHIGHGVFAHR